MISGLRPGREGFSEPPFRVPLLPSRAVSTFLTSAERVLQSRARDFIDELIPYEVEAEMSRGELSPEVAKAHHEKARALGFVTRVGYRRRGIASALLTSAKVFATDEGASLVEGYPVDGERASAVDYFTGTLGMFEEEGFVELMRRNPTRPIVRLTV